MLTADLLSSSAQILVGPEAGTWVVNLDGQYWLIGDRLSALIISGYAMITANSDDFSRAREACLGKVFVRSEGPGATCRMGFVDWLGNPINDDINLTALAEDLHFATWVFGMHSDRWVDISSAVHVEGANRMVLDLYLPPQAASSTGEKKGVKITVDGETIHAAQISRGRVTSVVLNFDGLAFGGKTVEIEAEFAEPMAGTGDARLLGCVVVGLSLARVDVSPSLRDQ